MSEVANVVQFPPRKARGLGFIDTTPKVASVNDKGPHVIALQMNLQTWGFPPGKLDGIYGANTRAAVSALQQFMGLPADGIFGPNTLAAVQRDLASTTGSRLKTKFEPRPPVVVAPVPPPTSFPVAKPATVPEISEPVYSEPKSKLPWVIGGAGLLLLALYIARNRSKASGRSASAVSGTDYLDLDDDDDEPDGALAGGELHGGLSAEGESETLTLVLGPSSKHPGKWLWAEKNAEDEILTHMLFDSEDEAVKRAKQDGYKKSRGEWKRERKR